MDADDDGPGTMRRGGLADFLRSRRERLDPRTLGLPDTGRRRRTPGLRREEVAERAGIGTDWYVRLEQGRDVGPSATTVDALARALCLDDTEHAHLRALVRAAPPAATARATATANGEVVPDTVRRLVRDMVDPAYLTGRRWDVLCWNAAAAAMLLDFAALPDADRNILVFMFLRPEGRRVFGTGWEAEARRMVAQFRPDFDLRAPGDPAFGALVRRLRAGSAVFAALWSAHEVRSGGSGRKRLQHPDGERRFEYATFRCSDDPALKLALYRPLRGDLPPRPGAVKASAP